MSNRKPNADLSRLCDEVGPEDGQDPREFHQKVPGRPSGGDNRKARQLCQQVQRALYWALGAECDDPALRSVEVVSVRPAPHAGRLLVTVDVGEADDAAAVLARLRAAGGVLRSAVAAAVNRRKVPELTFAALPAPQGGVVRSEWFTTPP